MGDGGLNTLILIRMQNLVNTNTKEALVYLNVFSVTRPRSKTTLKLTRSEMISMKMCVALYSMRLAPRVNGKFALDAPLTPQSI